MMILLHHQFDSGLLDSLVVPFATPLHQQHTLHSEETFHDPPPSSLLLESDKDCAGCILYNSTQCAGSIVLCMLLHPQTSLSELTPCLHDCSRQVLVLQYVFATDKHLAINAERREHRVGRGTAPTSGDGD